MIFQRRTALVVGIEKYSNGFKRLNGVLENAIEITKVLERRRFHIYQLPARFDLSREPGFDHKVSCDDLKKSLEKLFAPGESSDHDVGLFYFKGHGLLDEANGEYYLCTTHSPPTRLAEGKKENETFLSLRWLLELLNNSPVKKQIIWLDCCYSGGLIELIDEIGNKNFERLVITSCGHEEKALHVPPEVANAQSCPTFTRFLVDGLNLKSYKGNYKYVDSKMLYQWMYAKINDLPGQRICIDKSDICNIIITAENEFKAKYPGIEPYKPFQPLDNPLFFFGRDEEKQKLLEEVEAGNNVIVIGESGVGKSSLLRSGLVAQLKKPKGRGIKGIDDWLYISLGENPNIDHNIKSLGEEKISSDSKENEIENIISNLKNSCTDTSRKNLIIIDQFEEVYSDSQNKNILLINSLIEEIYNNEHRNLLFVIATDSVTCNSKNFEEVSLKINFSPPLMLKPITDEKQLKKIIEEPSALVGITIDSNLLSKLVSEFCQSSKNCLGLLQYLMSELCQPSSKQHGKNSVLVLEERDYDDKKKQDGENSVLVLEEKNYKDKKDEIFDSFAQTAYDKLTPADKEVARYILLKLIRIESGEQSERDTARARPHRTFKDLENSLWSEQTIRDVSNKLARHRLITISYNDKCERATVRISHAEFIERWQELTKIIKTNKIYNIKYFCKLKDQCDEWKKSNKKAHWLNNSTIKELDKLERDTIEIYKDLCPNKETEIFIEASKKKIESNNLILRLVVCLGFVVLVVVALWIHFKNQKEQEQKEQTKKANITSSNLLKEFNTDALTDLKESSNVGDNLTNFDDNNISIKDKSDIISSLFTTAIGRSYQKFRAIAELQLPYEVQKISVSSSNNLIAYTIKDENRIEFWKIGKDLKDVWKVKSGKYLPQNTNNSVISSVAFSPDDKILVGGSYQKIFIMRCRKGNNFKIEECISNLKTDDLSTDDPKNTTSDWVNSISFSHDGKLMASASLNQVIIWACKDHAKKISTCDPARFKNTVIRGDKKNELGWINTVAFVPENTETKNPEILAFAGEKGIISIVKITNNKSIDYEIIKDLKNKNQDSINEIINEISFSYQSSSRTLLLAAATKGKAIVWKIDGNKGNESLLDAIKSSKDEPISYGQEDWDLSGQAFSNSVSFSSPKHCQGSEADKLFLLSGRQDKIINVWSLGQCNSPRVDSIKLFQRLQLEANVKNVKFLQNTGQNTEEFVSMSYGYRTTIRLWQRITLGAKEFINLDPQKNISLKTNNNNATLPVNINSFSFDIPKVFLVSNGNRIVATRESPKNKLGVWDVRDNGVAETKDARNFNDGKRTLYYTDATIKENNGIEKIITARLYENDEGGHSLKLYSCQTKEGSNKVCPEEPKEPDVKDIFNNRTALYPKNGAPVLLSPDGSYLAVFVEKCDKSSNSKRGIAIWGGEKLFDKCIDDGLSKDEKIIGFDLSKNLNDKDKSVYFGYLIEKKGRNILHISKINNHLRLKEYPLEDMTNFNIQMFKFNPQKQNELAILYSDKDEPKNKHISFAVLKSSNGKDEDFSLKKTKPVDLICDDEKPIIEYNPYFDNNNNSKNTIYLAISCHENIYLYDGEGKNINILPHISKVTQFKIKDNNLISLDTDRKLYYWDLSAGNEQFYQRLVKFVEKNMLEESPKHRETERNWLAQTLQWLRNIFSSDKDTKNK